MAIISRQNDYSDLNLDFFRHPVTGDIVRLFGPDAVARSVRNLILTNFYDRPFRPYLGSSAQRLLFDNISSMTANLLEDHISQVIDNFEPRVTLLGVKVLADPDNNGYQATLAFTIVNRPEPYQVTIFLERIR